MRIAKRWSKPSKAKKAPPKSGVYEFGNARGEIIKIGEGDDLSERIPSALAEAGRQVKGIRWQEAKRQKALEKKMLLEFEKKHGRLPKLNKRVA